MITHNIRIGHLADLQFKPRKVLWGEWSIFWFVHVDRSKRPKLSLPQLGLRHINRLLHLGEIPNVCLIPSLGWGTMSKLKPFSFYPVVIVRNSGFAILRWLGDLPYAASTTALAWITRL